MARATAKRFAEERVRRCRGGNVGGVPWKAAMGEVKRFTRIAADAAGGSTFQDDEFPAERG
jgi:hypothetical protein